jgi:hypothetical protein
MLGTEANVRILRVLAAAYDPLGKSEVARQAQLNPAGVRRALRQLARFGIVEEVGKKPRQTVRLSEDHSLAPAIRRLFQDERVRFTGLVEALGRMVSRLEPPVRSAWIQGPVARGTDVLGDPIELGVLTSARDASTAREQLLSMIPEFIDDPDVQVVPRIWTAADVETAPDLDGVLEDAVLLVAPHPLQLLGRDDPGPRDPPGARHEERDRQASAWARALADRIEADPGLVRRAAEYARRRMESASARELHDLRDWLDLLEHKSISQVRGVLLGSDERATRMRQSLPFLGALTEEERREITRQASDDTPSER